jgi:hypothetical protein
MNYTTIPRSLIYKERKSLRDFGVYDEETLNWMMYRILRRYYLAELNSNDYAYIILDLFNESYYLCTMLLLDDRAGTNINDYIDAVKCRIKEPEAFFDMFRKTVFAMTYVFLEAPALDSHEIRTVRRHPRTNSFGLMSLMSETAGYKHPDKSTFNPINMLEVDYDNIDWAKVTNGFDGERIKDLIYSLGSHRAEKKILVERMFEGFIKCNDTYCIPYKIDLLLFQEYVRYGGLRRDLEIKINNEYLKESKTELVSRINANDEENTKLKKKIEQLEKRNAEMAKINVDLQKQLKKLTLEHSKTQEIDSVKEKEWQKLMDEMNLKVKRLQDKVGTKTVRLSSLVEGLKRWAKLRGLEAAKDMYVSLNYVLIKEPEWVNNTEELENFFYETELELKKPLLEIDNQQGGLIQITKGKQ